MCALATAVNEYSKENCYTTENLLSFELERVVQGSGWLGAPPFKLYDDPNIPPGFHHHLYL